MDELREILKETGIPFAYDHFAEGDSPEPPFICYLLPYSDDFSADGVNYLRIAECRVELYTDAKDPGSEAAVEGALSRHGVFWARSEAWIESEGLLLNIYSFDMKE